MPKRTVTVLGATGTVGQALLSLIEKDPDGFQVLGLTGFHNADRMADLIDRHRPEAVAVADRSTVEQIKKQCHHQPRFYVGDQAAATVAALACDWCLVAIAGITALRPAIAAIANAPTVAIANKEIIVAAGSLIKKVAHQHNTTLLPVDSEHNALFQLWQNLEPTTITKLILTASGGPLRTYDRSKLTEITPAMTLAHPNFVMGKKISVDSATMVNKVLEVIEAAWWFPIDRPSIDILIHPQQILHAIIALHDGTVLAHAGLPDMRLPLAHALYYPDRQNLPELALPLDRLVKTGLTFDFPCAQQHPALQLLPAIDGETIACVFSAANEIAVQAFLQNQLPFDQIVEVIRYTMDHYRRVCFDSSHSAWVDIETILGIDQQARDIALNRIAHV